MKFLIIQQKMIGDVLTSTVICHALKQQFSTCQTHYIVNYNTMAVVKGNPYVDRLIVVEKNITESKLKTLQFARSLKDENYTAIIDAYGSLGSMLISLFTKAKTKVAYHKSYSSFIYNKTIERLKEPQYNFSLAIENRMRLLKPLGVPFLKLMPKIYLSDSEIESGKSFLQENGIALNKKLYMISVLGSGKKKTYPENYMAQLLDYLFEFEPDCQILFNYIPSQLEEARKIYDLTKPKTKKYIFFDVYAKDLRSFLSVTKHCDALIGNEGGANNMAKALDVPTFTIFAPYLNKQNWFGENEEDDHIAVHLSDLINMKEKDFVDAKNKTSTYYQKIKPELIKNSLKKFLSNID